MTNQDQKYISWMRSVEQKAIESMALKISELGFCPREFCDRSHDEEATCHDCIREYYEEEARKEVAPF